jgi:hypothetical protein
MSNRPLARTFKERMALAARAGFQSYFKRNRLNFDTNREYYNMNPDAISPGLQYLEDFLEPFIELEQHEMRLRYESSIMGAIERERVMSEIKRLKTVCAERLKD